MAEAKSGDTVQVHYTGTLEDGTAFDTSRGHEPLEFVLGEGQIIPGFDKAVTGMNVGESKSVIIPPEEGYGPLRDDMTTRVSRTDLPADMDPKQGMILQVETKQGGTATVTVTEVTDEAIVIDANHPLAGKDLNFEIELVAIA